MACSSPRSTAISSTGSTDTGRPTSKDPGRNKVATLFRPGSLGRRTGGIRWCQMFGEHMQDLLGQHIEDKDLPTRELTLEEALAIGMQLHQDDRLAEADVVYGQVLAVAPGHPVAL